MKPGFVVSDVEMFQFTVRSHSISNISDAKTVTNPIDPARHSFLRFASSVSVCALVMPRLERVSVPADAVPRTRSNTVPDIFCRRIDASVKLQAPPLLMSSEIVTVVHAFVRVPRIWNATLFCMVSAIDKKR